MSHSPTPQQPRKPRDRPKDRPRSGRPPTIGMMWSITLITAMIIGAPLCFLVWAVFQVWGNEDVVSRQPIGAFVHMSTSTNWSGSVVIQTDQGFLPLKRAVVIRTGTQLVLEVRGSGRRYVCDQPRTLCVETSKEGFKSQEEAAKEGAHP